MPLFIPKKLVQRFWERVDKNGPMHPVCGQCWVWTRGTNSSGYGTISYSCKVPIDGRTCRMRAAHRISWLIHYGRIPDGLNVLHKCDNPPCVNPSHLFLGTMKDNHQDRNAKGRQFDPSGEAHGQAVLTTKDVNEIRRLLGTGLKQHEIAARFGISRGHVSMIKIGRTRTKG